VVRPVRRGVPGLLKFWKEFGSRPGLDLLAVSVDGDWKTVEGWIAEGGSRGVPLALDPEKKTASAFGTDKFPETYVLSPSGKVLEKFVGAVDWSSPSVRNRIEQLRQASTTNLTAAEPGIFPSGLRLSGKERTRCESSGRPSTPSFSSYFFLFGYALVSPGRVVGSLHGPRFLG